MKTVITYGTYDLLHYGHIRLLERAKSLGDYLIVGVTSDDFDRSRGKINVQQSLIERMDAIKQLDIADAIIVEEYEGQKIDDIRKYGADIFTVGSDWVGKFDYLKEYCEVVYLDRTEGVSSTEIRNEKQGLRIGFVGDDEYLEKFFSESKYVNGLKVTALCRNDVNNIPEILKEIPFITDNYDEFLNNTDAVFIHSYPDDHYKLVKKALINGKHVLCEAPLTLEISQLTELWDIASDNNCILVEALKTVYSTAYSRLLLMVKSGIVGKVMSVEATCTSLKDLHFLAKSQKNWNSICAWGPTAMLPVFQILGCDYKQKQIITHFYDESKNIDAFTKINFIYEQAVASVKIGQGVKSEGELIISGTDGYIIVPAPWWKTEYFEVRYEDMGKNKRYYFQLDGEGIRYELLAFCKAVDKKTKHRFIEKKVTKAMVNVINDFYKRQDFTTI